jgi:hypothetical protein
VDEGFHALRLASASAHSVRSSPVYGPTPTKHLRLLVFLSTCLSLSPLRGLVGRRRRYLALRRALVGADVRRAAEVALASRPCAKVWRNEHVRARDSASACRVGGDMSAVPQATVPNANDQGDDATTSKSAPTRKSTGRVPTARGEAGLESTQRYELAKLRGSTRPLRTVKSTV